MNIAIAKAMLREQFQRTLPILVLGLGIGAAPCLILYLVRLAVVFASRPEGSPNMEVEFVAFPILMAHTVCIIGLLYWHSDERDLKLNIPGYLLRLPVRTFDLIFLRMGYGLFCVAVIGIGSSSVYYLLFGSEMDAIMGFWTPLRIGVTLFACLQALAWCIGGSGLAATFAALLLYWLMNWLVFDFQVSFFDPSGYTTGVVLSAVAASFLVAYVGVRSQRREGINISGILGALPSAISRAGGVDPPPFASPEKAMRWLEWRRQGWIFPVLVLMGSVIVSIYWLTWSDALAYRRLSWSALMAAYGATVVVAIYTSLLLAAIFFGPYRLFQNQRVQLGPQKSFLFIRPVSTKALATARIYGVLRSVLISMVPLVVAFAVAALLAARSEFPNGLPVLVGHMGLNSVPTAILVLLGSFAIIWCLQWFGNAVALFAIFGLSALIVALCSAFDYVGPPTYIYVLRIVAAIAIPLCAYLFYLAHRRGLLDRKNLVLALAAWPFLAAGYLTIVNLNQLVGGNSLSLVHVPDILPLAVLPIAPLATVPLLMHFARHR